jgi:hypothetical protein
MMQGHLYRGAETRERFVHAVINNFIDQMMQAVNPG